MDISHPVESSLLQVKCSHCGHLEDDEWESLDNEQLHDLRCANCGHALHIAVTECQGCGDEFVFSWASRPTSDWANHLRCAGCNRGLHDHE
jgi:uncharacterized OB-fold protein